MTTMAILQGLFYVAVLLALAWPVGLWIAYVMSGRFAFGLRVERLLYRYAGVSEQEQTWWQYASGLILLHGVGLLALYALQRLQADLPLNAQALGPVAVDTAWNTAVSFVTNTNWQSYSGESTMSDLTQMLGLSVQNFLSAASGIAVLMALVRGLSRHEATTVGNVWIDLWRSVVWILLPLSLLFALCFVASGVVQSFAPALSVQTLQDQLPQTIRLGPVASQEAIKLLGTNGGGFFNVNSAHPFENPSAWSNLLQMWAILLIPAALCVSFGVIVGDRRQGLTLLAVMTVLLLAFAVATTVFEQQGNPGLRTLGVDQMVSTGQSGGNMEGKESRFGIAASSLFATVTTAASCGAVNAMHDSFTPLGGALPLVLMQLGEVVFGGVGSGLYGMLLLVLVTVFIAGLMIGRSPHYLGKRIVVFDMKMVVLALLITPLMVLFGTASMLWIEGVRQGMGNPGIHGYSEVLYAFSSAANNNGSAFAGLNANTPLLNGSLGLVMWLGRFGVIIPVLALAGSMAAKKRHSPTLADLPTHGPLFAFLLMGVILMLGLLNYVPALVLGPIAEHMQSLPF